MDVSNLLATHSSKYPSTSVEKLTPLEIDTGFLTVVDPNPIDADSYTADLEEHLSFLARDGVQVLLGSLFTLPPAASSDSANVRLPPSTTPLPRTKQLPKPAPLTKWEQFAKAKGISHVKKDRKVWDEDRQDWVNRWGRNGKNKEGEEAWIREVPMGKDADFDPRAEERKERRDRVRVNEKKKEANLARAGKELAKERPNRGNGGGGEREERKRDIERTLSTARVSTASMGRFDSKLEGEKKMRGVKRKFDAPEVGVDGEKSASLALINRMDSDARKMRSGKPKDDSLNVRKAVRFASKGRGGLALGRERAGSSRGGRGPSARGGKGRK